MAIVGKSPYTMTKSRIIRKSHFHQEMKLFTKPARHTNSSGCDWYLVCHPSLIFHYLWPQLLWKAVENQVSKAALASGQLYGLRRPDICLSLYLLNYSFVLLTGYIREHIHALRTSFTIEVWASKSFHHFLLKSWVYCLLAQKRCSSQTLLLMV